MQKYSVPILRNDLLNDRVKFVPTCPVFAGQVTFVTEFWKITHMGMPETIRIFEFSMALLIAATTFKNISNSTFDFRHLLQS